MKRLYRALLHLYPAAFREEYGKEMELAFANQKEPWAQAIGDIVRVAPREHLYVILQDLRYAFRAVRANPGFAAVAIASLALGIGANTAIFSLWHTIARAPLPLVKQPEQLVLLTDPTAIGRWFGDQGGERSWLTYGEFELMRDHLEGVSSVIAAQSSLDDWRVQIQGGAWEGLRGHFVSGGYFDLLGVAPLLGRAFTLADDHRDSAYAVLSYNYWMRRFGGRADVIGQRIAFRKMPVTVVGVMPRGFIGEVAAQQPDMWIPARMQPLLTNGRSLLRDQEPGPRKFMWLHVLARMKPGVTLPQIQSRAEVLFNAEMLRSYGKPVDQHLVIHDGSRGVSDSRAGFSNSLSVMLGGASTLLLIACANLANLLLARGAARRSEFAIRIAQGASRGRLVRQLVTESLLLSLTGAIAGIILASFLHRVLVAGMTKADSDFALDFHLSWIAIAFTIATTLLATVLFGLIPAWRVTHVDAQESLRDQNRSATASFTRMRFARILVALQLALALPLLASAGLLVRTVQNTLNVNLGYQPRGLVQVRVEAQDAGYTGAREDALRERLRLEMERIPGVQAVSYSDNGFFTGGRSFDSIEVEGYTPQSVNDKGSRLDVVGPNFFELLGVRPVAGRTFLPTDTANAPQVIVINEAFANRFFAGRDPLGKRVTARRGKADQQIFHIIGIVPGLSTQNDTVKSPAPQYYVSAAQRGADRLGLVFAVRTATPTSVFPAVRRIVSSADSSLPVELQTVEEAMEPLTAETRMVSWLAIAFGSVALLLAALGLYGVLAYGVARRRGEIGLRIALGAERKRVVGLILWESAGVVAGGILLGLGPAYAASQLVQSQFAEFSPQDPKMLVGATVVLLVVAFLAAYFPARRASRLDPMIALRSE